MRKMKKKEIHFQTQKKWLDENFLFMFTKIILLETSLDLLVERFLIVLATIKIVIIDLNIQTSNLNQRGSIGSSIILTKKDPN